MTNLSLRELNCDDNLYADAVNSSAAEWIKKYKIHSDFVPNINHFSVGSDGTHSFETSVNPKLYQGYARLFLLGVQIASEEKGNGGRSPANNVCIGYEYLTDPATEEKHSQVRCSASYDGGLNVSRGYIDRVLSDAANGSFVNSGHMPDQHLDGYQIALMAGVEEGLHSESYKLPGNIERFSCPQELVGTSSFNDLSATENRARNLQIVAEEYIHSDYVSICEKIAPVYSFQRWEAFVSKLG